VNGFEDKLYNRFEDNLCNRFENILSTPLKVNNL